MDEAAAQVRQAFRDGNYVAVSTAFNRAKALRPGLGDEAFEPLAKAIAEGIDHRDPSIAFLSVKTLGELHNAGSGRYLVRLLSPPGSPSVTELKLHLAAIEAAGTIHDEDSLTKLIKLPLHTNTEIAVAGCEALARYRWVDRKTRLDLIRRLATTLGRLEKKRATKAMRKIHLALVKEALVETLQQLAQETGLGTAAEFRAWLREERKRQVN